MLVPDRGINVAFDEDVNLDPTREKARKALLIALIGIGFFVIYQIVDFIYTAVELGKMDDWMWGYPNSFFISRIIIFTILYLLFSIFIVIWLIRSLLFAKRIGERYRRIVIWSLVFVITRLIISYNYDMLLSPSLSYMAFSDEMSNVLFVFITSSIHLILLFMLVFAIIIPILPFVSKRIGWLAIAAGSLFILTNQLFTDIFWVMAYRGRLDEMTYETYLRIDMFLFTGLRFVSFILIGIVFYLAFRKIRSHNINDSFFVKFKPFSSARNPRIIRIRNFFARNPYRLFIIFGIISIIYGSIIGFAYGDPYERDDDEYYYDDSFDDFDYSYEVMTTMFDGDLMEGEEEVFNVGVGVDVSWITVSLNWVDEPNLIGRTNTPDLFVLTVNAEGVIQEESGENPVGGTGDIYVDLFETGYIEELEITVHLADAGDQKMRTGPGFIGWTDDSNSFELSVWIEYYI